MTVFDNIFKHLEVRQKYSSTCRMEMWSNTVFWSFVIYYMKYSINWFLILQHEATKVMQDALHEFGGTPEEVRLVVLRKHLTPHF